jgi:VCBS repeat-containing protein
MPATQLAFTTPERSGTVGTCLGPITVQTQNANNAATNVQSNTTVNLATDNGTNGSGAFYSDSGCSTLTSSRTINAGSDSATFYYKGTARGDSTHELTASASGLASAKQTQTILGTYNLSVTKSGTGEGTVTSSPTGIDCGSDCSETYNEGTNVTLTATADSGSTFAGWSGAGTTNTDGTRTVTMSAARSVTATFNHVNRAPVAVDDDDYSVDEDDTLTADGTGGNPNGVLFNDTDDDNDPLTATLVKDVDNGTLNLNSDGTFTYTPDDNFNGEDSFTYKANDGTADSNVATVTITVNEVNDKPTCEDVSITTAEDTQGSTSPNCTDPEGDPFTYSVSQPANGTASVVSGDLTYDPDLNFNGPDTFTYKANDGTADSDAANVDVTVTAVNDPPDAVNDDA